MITKELLYVSVVFFQHSTDFYGFLGLECANARMAFFESNNYETQFAFLTEIFEYYKVSEVILGSILHNQVHENFCAGESDFVVKIGNYLMNLNYRLEYAGVTAIIDKNEFESGNIVIVTPDKELVRFDFEIID